MRDLAKHRRTPMSPTQLIPPTSPGQVFAGDGRLRRRFSHTGHGPFRALIVSNLKWGGPCRDHYVLTRETLSGRRPADGADTPGGVFRSGENLPGEAVQPDIILSGSALRKQNHSISFSIQRCRRRVWKLTAYLPGRVHS